MRLPRLSIFTKFSIIITYKIVSAIKTCRNISYQMISKIKIENAWNGLNRSRKLVVLCLLLLVLLLYWWPTWLSRSNTKVRVETLDVCIDAELSYCSRGENPFDVLTKHAPLELDEKDFVQYVGNGYLGAALQDRAKLWLRGSDHVLSQDVHFYPIARVAITGYHTQEAYVTNLRAGLISRVQCFKIDDSVCVTASQQVYAHRARPSLLVQEFRIHNPSDSPVTVDLELIGPSSWEDAQTTVKRAEQVQSAEVRYTLLTGTHKLEGEPSRVLVVAIAAMQPPVSVTVQPASKWLHHLVTAVRYERVSEAEVSETRQRLEAQVDAEFLAAVIVNSRLLREEHTQVWDKLWFSGFGISKSLAPGAVNGDNINMTMYYVMSHTPAPIHELATQTNHRLELERLLYFPESCYDRHHTVQNEGMWYVPSSVRKSQELARTWILTLNMSGCGWMLRAGADGALQSMMLSIGGLQFKNQHLEFRTQPRDLHRDYFWRRLNYGNNTHLNMSVIVGEDNKAVIHAALDRNDRDYWACDAGCLDPPAKLSREMSVFAVKLTEPLTPLLYITFDHQHMEMLKHSIHVREIKLAPAHEHHVMAMHRHGHHLGGLPVLFWGSLGALILVFHLFLCKLIYNEYLAGPQDRYSRGRYSL